MATDQNRNMNSQEPDQILSRMTMKEKIGLCYGANYWQTRAMPEYGIPPVFMCDGPHGLRKQDAESKNADMLGIRPAEPATCFPAGASIGCSWDTALTARLGEAIALEAKAAGVDVFLGPAINLKRNPLCGRNFEYYSEDPFLAGKLGASYIAAAEALGVGVSLKHFAANSQENHRFVSDSVVDDRALRELYLTAFEIAIREGRPSTVMCAYNKLNGEYCSDNKWLLHDILREEWGFDGLVVTDWGAMHDRVRAFAAGCDLCMPGGNDYMAQDALKAVETGELPAACVDNSAARVIRLAMKNAEKTTCTAHFDVDKHHALAREMAEQSAVLLKNDGSLLPIRPDQSVVLIGAMAAELRYQGTGSSHINPTRLVSLRGAMPDCPYAHGCLADGSTSEELLREAAEAARQVQVAVVCAGLPPTWESEGFDRASMAMPDGHTKLIEAVANANSNTVVVLFCGGAIETPWAGKVKSVLYMGLPGQAGGEAARNLLYGRANPSGKLAETWPIHYSDCPSAGFFGSQDALYLESIYVGYRYYHTAKVPVRWPFGYGLSYTSFAYSNLVIVGNQVNVTVRNTGSVAGAEVAQLYIEPPAGGLHRPVQELKGFQKVFLQPGDETRVSFSLDERCFAIWSDGWKIPGGAYTVYVGGGSDPDSLLEAAVELPGQPLPAPSWQAGSWYEAPLGIPSQSGWEAMMGRAYMPYQPQKGRYTMNDTLADMRDHSLVMAMVYRGIEKQLRQRMGKDVSNDSPVMRMMLASTVESPLRSLVINGGLDENLFSGLVDVANGHPVRGLKRILGKKR